MSSPLPPIDHAGRFGGGCGRRLVFVWSSCSLFGRRVCRRRRRCQVVGRFGGGGSRRLVVVPVVYLFAILQGLFSSLYHVEAARKPRNYNTFALKRNYGKHIAISLRNDPDDGYFSMPNDSLETDVMNDSPQLEIPNTTVPSNDGFAVYQSSSASEKQYKGRDWITSVRFFPCLFACLRYMSSRCSTYPRNNCEHQTLFRLRCLPFLLHGGENRYAIPEAGSINSSGSVTCASIDNFRQNTGVLNYSGKPITGDNTLNGTQSNILLQRKKSTNNFLDQIGKYSGHAAIIITSLDIFFKTLIRKGSNYYNRIDEVRDMRSMGTQLYFPVHISNVGHLYVLTSF